MGCLLLFGRVMNVVSKRYVQSMLLKNPLSIGLFDLLKKCLDVIPIALDM